MSWEGGFPLHGVMLPAGARGSLAGDHECSGHAIGLPPMSEETPHNHRKIHHEAQCPKKLLTSQDDSEETPHAHHRMIP